MSDLATQQQLWQSNRGQLNDWLTTMLANDPHFNPWPYQDSYPVYPGWVGGDIGGANGPASDDFQAQMDNYWNNVVPQLNQSYQDQWNSYPTEVQQSGWQEYNNAQDQANSGYDPGPVFLGGEQQANQDTYDYNKYRDDGYDPGPVYLGGVEQANADTNAYNSYRDDNGGYGDLAPNWGGDDSSSGDGGYDPGPVWLGGYEQANADTNAYNSYRDDGNGGYGGDPTWDDASNWSDDGSSNWDGGGYDPGPVWLGGYEQANADTNAYNSYRDDGNGGYGGDPTWDDASGWTDDGSSNWDGGGYDPGPVWLGGYDQANQDTYDYNSYRDDGNGGYGGDPTWDDASNWQDPNAGGWQDSSLSTDSLNNWYDPFSWSDPSWQQQSYFIPSPIDGSWGNVGQYGTTSPYDLQGLASAAGVDTSYAPPVDPSWYGSYNDPSSTG